MRMQVMILQIEDEYQITSSPRSLFANTTDLHALYTLNRTPLYHNAFRYR